MSSDKSRAPKLDTKNWSLFKLKLLDYLSTKGNADKALNQPRPKMASSEVLLQLRREEQRVQKVKSVKRQISHSQHHRPRCGTQG